MLWFLTFSLSVWNDNSNRMITVIACRNRKVWEWSKLTLVCRKEFLCLESWKWARMEVRVAASSSGTDTDSRAGCVQILSSPRFLFSNSSQAHNKIFVGSSVFEHTVCAVCVCGKDRGRGIVSGCRPHAGPARSIGFSSWQWDSSSWKPFTACAPGRGCLSPLTPITQLCVWLGELPWLWLPTFSSLRQNRRAGIRLPGPASVQEQPIRPSRYEWIRMVGYQYGNQELLSYGFKPWIHNCGRGFFSTVP